MTPALRVHRPLALAVALAAATMLLPWVVAAWWTGGSWAGPHDLAVAVSDGLVSDWTHGVPAPGAGTSALRGPTDFWRWFHVVKALLAAGVLLAATIAAVRAWTEGRTATTRWRRAAARLTSLAAWGMSGLALLVVIANVQGAVAPLSSVLSFLPLGRRDADVAAVVAAVRADLAGSAPSSATDVVVADFSTYHVVVAVIAGAVVVASIVLAVRLWRRGGRASSVLLAVVAAGFGVLVAANVSTALAPAPALDAFLRGLAT